MTQFAFIYLLFWMCVFFLAIITITGLALFIYKTFFEVKEVQIYKLDRDIINYLDNVHKALERGEVVNFKR